MRRLIFSPQASLDLESIGDYIARDNSQRALSFLAAIKVHCHQILEMPRAFPKRDDILPGLQMCVHGNYLILFHADDAIVRIERIVHGARRLQNLF